MITSIKNATAAISPTMSPRFMAVPPTPRRSRSRRAATYHQISSVLTAGISELSHGSFVALEMLTRSANLASPSADRPHAAADDSDDSDRRLAILTAPVQPARSLPPRRLPPGPPPPPRP